MTNSKGPTKGAMAKLLLLKLINCHSINSALESMIKKHATNSAAFSGKGQTLGGDPAAPDIVGETKATFDGAIKHLDPQLKVLLGLLGLYFIFWFFR